MAMTALDSLLFTVAVLSGVWMMSNFWEAIGEEHCEDRQCENNRKFMNEVAHSKFYEINSLSLKPSATYYH